MTVREEVSRKIGRDVLLARLRQKIDSGKGTYADSFAYSDRAGKLLGEVFSRRLPDIPPEEREALCAELLHDRYTDINSVTDSVQNAQDAAQGLHLAPQHAPFNNERAHQIGSATADQTVPVETQQRRAKSATATMTRAMHDDRMKAEAKFRSRAGLKCYITRMTDGKCCPWCSKVAGRYEYGREPDGIYRRHDNCSCTVTFENGRRRQDVWSKREWESPKEGAGAGDPVVFTAEQAAAAGAGAPVVLTKEQAKSLQDSILTNGAENGIMIKTARSTGERNPFHTDLPDEAKRYLSQLQNDGDVIESESSQFTEQIVSTMSRAEGVEFAKVSFGSKAILIRGDEKGVYFSPELIAEIVKRGGSWDFHTHPFNSDLRPSPGDIELMEKIYAGTGQESSRIITPDGKYSVFGVTGLRYTGELSNTLDDEYRRRLMELFGGE